MAAAVKIAELTVSYAETPVFDLVSFEVAPHTTLALTGPSGSGKSTLLGCITGTTVPTSGTVEVGGVRVTDLNSSQRASFRRQKVALLFQTPDLLPELSVVENVALISLFDGMSRVRALSDAREALAAVGLDGLQDRRVDELSGGEAQRVAVVRALSRTSVELVVADEPTAALDATNARLITGTMLDFAARRGVSVIVATHDPAVAQRMDRTIDMLALLGQRAA